MIINRQNLQKVFTGFQTIFNEAFAGAPSDWDKIAMVAPSTTAAEQYAWMRTTTRFREWLGDRVIQNLSSSDYTIKNRKFENTIGVDRDQIEDDTYGVYKPMIQQLGYDAKQHPNELVFGLVKSGFTTTCYDTQYFFDTDHPVLDANGAAQSVSNFQGGAGTPWYLLDVTRPIKPFIFQRRKDYSFCAMDQESDEAVFSRGHYRYGTEARVNAGFGLWQLAYASKQTLDVTNYAAARAAMQSMTGDNGKPLGVQASLLLVPPNLEGAARTILNAEQISGSTNVYRGTAQLLVSPWLV